jgi:cytochrome c553
MTRLKICVLAMVGLPLAALGQAATVARNLAATCASCHGSNGQARGDMPSLQGVAADKIVAAMTDFKSGSRQATVMHQIAKGYTDDQIRLVAGFFAAQQTGK